MLNLPGRSGGEVNNTAPPAYRITRSAGQYKHRTFRPRVVWPSTVE